MSSSGASAPGKLVLLGEYAVLSGHPAMVAAVNRRARVELRHADDGRWSVAAPGYAEHAAAFDIDRSRGFRWREADAAAVARFGLVERVIGSLAAAKLIDPGCLPPGHLVLDTQEFFQRVAGGEKKLGLGSSAALTVALTQAVRRWGAGSGVVELGSLVELHRSFQGGRGSGIDIAASLVGGVVEYRLAGRDRSPFAHPLEIPDGLRLVFVWTGRSASTSDFLARLDAGMRSDGGVIAGSLAELGMVSAAGIADLRSGKIAAFLADVNDFADSMEKLGRAAGIPILSEEHVALRELARDCGLSYKPSGAGGGDVGIGFTDDPEAAVVFAGRAEDAGFPILGLEIDPLGAQVEHIESS